SPGALHCASPWLVLRLGIDPGSFISRERPAERMSCFSIPVCDESGHRATQLFHAPETPVSQATFLEDSEPELHLIDPRGMERGVVKPEAVLVPGVELIPAFAVVD